MAKVIRFTERNDWEGENWTVFFEVEDNLYNKVKDIQRYINIVSKNLNDTEESFPYWFKEHVNNTLPTEKELEELSVSYLYDNYTAEDLEYMDDDEGGYYPTFSVLDAPTEELNNLWDKLNNLSKSASNEDILNVLDDCCYKLNLFYN